MVVHDFNISWAVVGPSEADAELIIDPDAVLAFAVALQGFQPVAWWG